MFNTPSTVLLQETVEPDYMGRVFGVLAMISSSRYYGHAGLRAIIRCLPDRRHAGFHWHSIAGAELLHGEEQSTDTSGTPKESLKTKVQMKQLQKKSTSAT